VRGRKMAQPSTVFLAGAGTAQSPNDYVPGRSVDAGQSLPGLRALAGSVSRLGRSRGRVRYPNPVAVFRPMCRHWARRWRPYGSRSRPRPSPHRPRPSTQLRVRVVRVGGMTHLLARMRLRRVWVQRPRRVWRDRGTALSRITSGAGRRKRRLEGWLGSAARLLLGGRRVGGWEGGGLRGGYPQWGEGVARP
jgi:hypothetical protein